jgi:preprotein translocase subunit Sec61beta
LTKAAVQSRYLNIFICGFWLERQVISMPKEKKGSGFQSAAGLIRYFDSEDEKALKVSPYIVIGLIVSTIVIVSVLNVIFPV